MDIIFEIIIDLIIEGSIEGSKSNKLPKWLRYLLLFIVILFFLSVISVIVFMGISILKDNIIGGIIIILFGLFLLILSCIKFKEIYLKKNL